MKASPSASKPGRRGMVWTGWAMTLIGMGIVLFWTLYEAVNTFASAPIYTILGVLVVFGVVALLVPIPLFLATRRAQRLRRH